MPRPEPIRLRETPSAARGEVEVIDARYTIVRQGGGPRWLASAGRWLAAFALAALFGAAIPPLWALAKAVAGMLG